MKKCDIIMKTYAIRCKICLVVILSTVCIDISAQVIHRTLPPRSKTEGTKVVNQHREDEYNGDETETKCNYLNFGYQRLVMKPDGGQNLTSNLGLYASIGKTFLLNSEPGVFNYGIDVVWADLNYVNYKLEYHYEGMTEKETFHQMEIGIQGGLAMIIKPSSSLNTHVYARYAPCLAAMYVDKEFYGNYGNFLVAGLSLNFGSVGIGAEYRYGSCTYKSLKNSDIENMEVEMKTESLPSTKFSGFRTYLVYNF